MNPSVEENHAAVMAAIDRACRLAQRPRHDVQLIAVSKTVPIEAIRAVYRCGQIHYAESRWQEAQAKMEGLPPEIVWHFIGRIQRNKVRKILEAFSTIHSLDSLRLAHYMNSAAGDLGKRPDVFLEINLGDEESKGGFTMDGIESCFAEIKDLPHLHVIGLMCIPPYGPPEESRRYFQLLRECRDRLQQRYGTPLPSLSMGMSHDYAIAIEEGATHIRVGSAIFGARDSDVQISTQES